MAVTTELQPAPRGLNLITYLPVHFSSLIWGSKVGWKQERGLITKASRSKHTILPFSSSSTLLPSQLLLFSSNSQTSREGFLHCLVTSSFSSPCQPSTKLPLLPNIPNYQCSLPLVSTPICYPLRPLPPLEVDQDFRGPKINHLRLKNLIGKDLDILSR